MSNYKLTYTDGCTCTSLDVDGKEWNLDVDIDTRRDICNKMIYEGGEPFAHYICDYEEYEIPQNISHTQFLNTKICDCNGNDLDCILQLIFIKFMEEFGRGGYEYTCDCCGDSVYSYTYKI